MFNPKIEQGEILHPPAGATISDLHSGPIGAGGVVRHHLKLSNPQPPFKLGQCIMQGCQLAFEGMVPRLITPAFTASSGYEL